MKGNLFPGDLSTVKREVIAIQRTIYVVALWRMKARMTSHRKVKEKVKLFVETIST